MQLVWCRGLPAFRNVGLTLLCFDVKQSVEVSAMIKPPFVKPGEDVKIVGRVFNTPLVVKGKTWFPLVQLAAWPILSWVAGRRKPERSWGQRLVVGALTTPVVLGSEWCHNLAHAAAARWVSKPMDAIRVVWGMPLLIYYDINDASVSPPQHIARALGGPVFNALLFFVARLLKRQVCPGSALGEMAEAAEKINAFIAVVGLLPIPGIDGGPILKWSLVELGRTPAEADQDVRKVNGVLGATLAGAGVVALKRKRWLEGGLLVMLAATALSIASGLLKEQ